MMLDSDTPSGGAERRYITLLFVDLSGSSRLAEALEAEDFAEVLRTLRVTSVESIERFGGRVVRSQGDGVLAVFGYPTAAEDDSLRAAQAALDLHGNLDRAHRAELPAGLRPLQLHSGLHSGLVLISPGDIECGRFELVGDAANTAARLSQLAPAGALLADLDSLGPHARHFEIDATLELALPGRSVRVRAARITRTGGPLPPPNGKSGPALGPIFGRERLLAALASHLAENPSANDPRRIVLQGPAGIGKSRLLHEIAQLPQASAWVCLRGACADEARSQVLQPFVEMMRSLHQPLPETTDRLADELFGAIAAAAGRRGLLLLIDDWQWADDASRQLLERLASSLPVMLAVVASRPVHEIPTPGDGEVRYDLAPFEEAETARLVKLSMPAADPFTIGEIHRQAGGVPLYVEELAHSAASQQPMNAAQPHLGTSGWLVALVAARLARLSAEQQEIVRTAAVLGDSFPVWLLLSVGGWRQVDLDLGALARADFLFPLDNLHRLRFKHGLTRRAVYDTVGLHERRAMHRRATRAMAAASSGIPTMDALEGLAYHSRAAGLWDEAADYAEHAADQAMAAFAMDVARRHCLVALEALEAGALADLGAGNAAALERWCKVVHKLGMACIFDPLALPDALPIFERCLERAQASLNGGLIARSLYWLGYVCYGQGQPRRAARHCQEALATARDMDDKRLVAQLEATLGQVLAAAGDYEAALPLMDRALAAKRQGARGGGSVAVGSAFTLACKASVLADRGDFPAAHALLADASRLVGDTPHPVANSVRNWAMVVLLWQGRWQDALEVTSHGVRMATRTQALLPLAISRACEGYARWLAGGTVDGLEQIAQALDWMERRQGKFFSSIYHGWLVEGFVASADVPAARRHAALLFARARAGERLGLAQGCRAMALAAAQTGDVRRADHWLAWATRCAMERTSRREAALNELCRAEILVRFRRSTTGVAHARRAHADFKAMGMQWHADRAATLL